jgi:hypothetical protein
MHNRSRTQPDARGPGEDVMMVVSMLCKLASEIYVDGWRVTRAVTKQDDDARREAGARRDATTRYKRSQTISSEGREVVCPGYSTWMHAGGEDMTEDG